MPVINLSGPEGNAFSLIGTARTWARQLGIDAVPIITDMTSGDYHHLLDVMEQAFPHVGLEFLNDPRDPDTTEEY